ncbi:hypothetical protein V1512DRAFT_266714 [Lipomyces arxii]|uniref:uncharacterized protein n=1 Tax=Lipomyces arxii TaxID=56418 RepID=UPI0034CDAA16
MGSLRSTQDTKLAIVPLQDNDSDRDIDPLNPVVHIDAKSPKIGAPEFKYEYSDTDSTRTELDEWFAYSDAVYVKESLDEFSKSVVGDWRALKDSKKRQYITAQLDAITNRNDVSAALKRLIYVAAGAFKEVDSVEEQLDLIFTNTVLLWKTGALSVLYQFIQHTIDTIYDETNESAPRLQQLRTNLFLALTVLYFIVENIKNEQFIDDLSQLNPNILAYFIKQIGLFRVHIPDDLPWRNIFLLTWKLTLRLLGTSKDLARAKTYARNQAGLPLETTKEAISTSPLDYQVFRQGISFRYPGYKPPSEIIPPKFAYTHSSAASSASSVIEFTNNPLPGSSVHIATPAPSPPPSPPPGGGKAKKSAFHTDQNVPFMFPQSVEIPVSIKEADEIFLKRMRTSLGTLQLWEEREEFMKQERGWIEPDEIARSGMANGTAPKNASAKRLARTEKLYMESLESLQSFIVVTLKVVLSTVSLESAGAYFKRQQFLDGQTNQPGTGDGLTKTELENARETEIILKAISGLIYLLLKWLKLSHILKFEFLSQLLYDSNVLPLFLQVFNTKEIDQFVLQIPEVPALKFFAICRTLAADKDIPDRETSIIALDESGSDKTVEEILQQEEITEFSRRNFFVSINLLKVMQKVCKNKAHRNLTLVQLKASNFLRKTLRISQFDARLYALKIIKGQVPYSGRKWRHMNMRVITAIYLYCRQELRDSWLATIDIDADVEDSYPREVALRALIQFYNTRRYPEALAALGYRNSEEDFFAKELDSLLLDDNIVDNGQI